MSNQRCIVASFATLRSASFVPTMAFAIEFATPDVFMIRSLALGLGTDGRVVSRAGLRGTGTATLSLAALGALSLGLIRILDLTGTSSRLGRNRGPPRTIPPTIRGGSRAQPVPQTS